MKHDQIQFCASEIKPIGVYNRSEFKRALVSLRQLGITHAYINGELYFLSQDTKYVVSLTSHGYHCTTRKYIGYNKVTPKLSIEKPKLIVGKYAEIRRMHYVNGKLVEFKMN